MTAKTTTETKYQIFVSSTFRDLKDWRRALIDQILRADHIPSGMEGFSAADEEDLKVIQRAIDQCDIYVVVVGSSFGSEIPNTNPTESFTQREFRYASEKGKPILAFILDDKDFEDEREALPSDSPEREHDDDIRQFREEVKTIEKDRHRIVEFFSKDEGVHSLTAKFITALNKMIRRPSFNMPGWLRLPPGVETNPFIKRIISKLASFDTLSYRCTADFPEVKEAMAHHFWYRFGAELINEKVWHLFFESGSTIAYVVERLRDKLESPSWSQNQSKLRLHTNNVLTYLEFILYEHLQLEIVPHGPPDDDDKYGATFGPFLAREEKAHPFTNEPLSKTDPGSAKLVEELKKKIVPVSKPSLILATASGLEAESDPEFPGPHVGTYRNKLVKRSLLQSGHPLVLFLDESKIAPIGVKGKFKKGYCHSVCDPEFSWQDAVRKQPLALCVGATSERRLKKVIGSLTQHETWSSEEPKVYDGGCAVVLYNDRFWKRFGVPASNSDL